MLQILFSSFNYLTAIFPTVVCPVSQFLIFVSSCQRQFPSLYLTLVANAKRAFNVERDSLGGHEVAILSGVLQPEPRCCTRMGSMAGPDTIAVDLVLPKIEPFEDGYSSSTVSTPEAEAEASAQDVVPIQKRKGGRKPVGQTFRNTDKTQSDPMIDLCYLRRTQTAQSSSPGRLSGTPNRIHQAAGNDHQTP